MKRIVFWTLIIPGVIIALIMGIVCAILDYFIRFCMTFCDVLDELEWWSIGMEAEEYINNPLKRGNFWQRVVKYWHDNDRPF